MGLMDFIKGELIDVIEWTDDSRDTLSFRFPDDDKAIKNGAQLIVRESQVVQFVYLGEFGDTFGPGKHTLTTDNIPVLTKLKSWKYGFNSPFKADVYYVTTRLFTGNKWGTANPIMMRDDDFGIVRVRAFGTYDFKIVDPKLFLKEVAGSDQNFRLDEFADTMRSRIVSVFTDALATAKVPVLDVASRYSELGEALLPLINPVVTAKYGIEMASFIVENVSVPPEVEQAIDKRSSMAAVGNLNDYVKFQMAQGMEKGGGAGGVATELAVGLAMAQQMMQQQGLHVVAAESCGRARRPRGAPGCRSCSRRPTPRRRSASPRPTSWRCSSRASSTARRSARRGASSGRRSTSTSRSRAAIWSRRTVSPDSIQPCRCPIVRARETSLPRLRRAGGVESGQAEAGLPVLRDRVAVQRRRATGQDRSSTISCKALRELPDEAAAGRPRSAPCSARAARR